VADDLGIGGRVFEGRDKKSGGAQETKFLKREGYNLLQF